MEAMAKTYKRINAVSTTISILRHMADQREPVAGSDVARAMDLSVGTVMCHLVTLEDARVVRRIGDKFELGDQLAVFWARRKANLESGIGRMKQQLENIGVSYDG